MSFRIGEEVKRPGRRSVVWWGIVPGVVRLRLSRNAMKKLFSSGKSSISKDLEDVLERYSEKVEEDVLEEFLRERR